MKDWVHVVLAALALACVFALVWITEQFVAANAARPRGPGTNTIVQTGWATNAAGSYLEIRSRLTIKEVRQ